ncbi:DUF2993 domain-containing protein [Microbispora triticiradicis]|uniref:DUF2993 domain-containing protein n=4 Tax=Streptosporangiaceae TaxID=2004 RepID=A0ABY3LSM1_9ACTN|nr:DUF2993 domain-containing protein [Microbispora triticiradicis]TLP62469.1 DUF2993 domain-containing protein [Microbispora fusca]TYB52024.1 DUF2993 domain-containing protein [Microbispora tritici]
MSGTCLSRQASPLTASGAGVRLSGHRPFSGKSRGQGHYAESYGRLRRSRMRKLVVAVVMLAILLVVLDRVAVVGVQREIARQIEAQYDLAQPPSVQVKGLPFLTQAFSGRYEEIAIGIGEVEREGVQLERIDATLYGVTAPLADLIQNAAAAKIGADRVVGTVVISRRTLSAHAPKGIKVEGTGDDKLRVSGNVTVLGNQVPVTADMKIEMIKDGIRLTPASVRLAGAIPVPNPERLISFTVPVKNLPLNLRITRVTSTSEGLAVQGTASDVSFK